MECMLESKSKKAGHAVFVPFPTQGHITPLLKLAKLFYHRGFYITFVNTEHNHNRLLNSKHYLENQLPGFRFETIPDASPHDPDLQTLCRFVTSKSCSLQFQRLVDNKLNHSPTVTCIVADGKMSFALHASKQLAIPCVLFWTFAACGFMSLKLCKDLSDMGVTPFKDSSYLIDGTLNAPVDWIPGLKNIQFNHIASFIRTTDPNDIFLEFVKEAIEATSKASAVILYTFDALERDMLDTLSPLFPPIYTIGPLQSLVDQIPERSLQFLDCSLWKAEEDCLQWLDSKVQNSVLYVNFGTIAVLTPNEILELAWGLANSKKNFLWIIRPDLIKGGNSKVIFSDFLDEIKERGMIARWVPQEKVLGHPSIGGFLSHCGWNSTIEGITAGVPFLCMPCTSEQFMNSKFLSSEWGTGIEVLKNCGRDDIERAVRKLIGEEDGKEMKKKAMELKAKAEEATSAPEGSSFRNLEKLIKLLEEANE